MAVDHCALVNVRAGVDEHWWHADDAGRDVCPVANTRSSGDDAHAICARERMNWVSILIEKAEAAIRRRHVNDRAHAKAEQNASFHPRVRVPIAIRVALCSANLAAIKRVLELFEQHKFFVRVSLSLATHKLFDLFTHKSV